MDTTALQNLKSKLPPKHLTTLAKTTGFTVGYVCRVLNGERENLYIIESAITLAEEHQANLKNVEKKLSAL